MAGRFRSALVVISFTLAMAPAAQAQATRTWVSGVGNDANPCSRTAPCKTFAGAISKTADGGFINIIDAGAFGTVTITKSITIDADGFHSGSLTSSGISGMIVNGAAVKVTIRNLAIETSSLTLPGNYGIRVLAAAEVRVENVFIANPALRGIDFSPSNAGELYVDNVTVANAGSYGIFVGNGRATVKNYRAMSCYRGLSVEGNAIASVVESQVGGGYAGFTAGTNAAAVLNVDRSVSANNQYGVIVGNSATVRLRDSMVMSNTDTGLLNDGTGAFVSLEGNTVAGNAVANGSFTSTIVKQ